MALIARMLEGLLAVVAVLSGLVVLRNRADLDGRNHELWQLIRSRRFPIVAVVVTGILLAGCLAQAAWPGTLDALRNDGSAQWWRGLTAPFVQDGGMTGAIFNLVSALVVLALSEWIWGRWITVLVWLAGAWAPIGDVVALFGYHTTETQQAAYAAGSSGATYTVAAGLCVALIVWGGRRERWAGAIGPVVAAAMIALANDGHSVMFLAGTVIAILVRFVTLAARIRLPLERQRSPRSEPVSALSQDTGRSGSRRRR